MTERIPVFEPWAASLASSAVYGTIALAPLFLSRVFLMRKQEYLTEDHWKIKDEYERHREELHDDTEHCDIRQRHEIVESRVVPQHWCLGSQNEHPADLQHGASYRSETA
jgi:hypothetical protein